MTTWLHGGQIVTATGIRSGGSVLITDGIITDVGGGHADAAGFDAPAQEGLTQIGGPTPLVPVGTEIVELAGRFVLPGFIDLHVHGGGGATFDDGAAALETGLATHRANGTTRSQISLVTAPVPDMLAALSVAAEYAAGDPSVLGVHLEGPFLAPDRRGVHDRRSLLIPDSAVLQRFLDAGRGQLQVMTVAPELPGGLAMVRYLVSAGVHPAVGHSDAGYDVAQQAFAAGADLVTHAFNGMRPMHHRDPGIVGAAMDAGVVLEAINDGVHLHDATLRLLNAVALGRIALITDAMGAAGAADGPYRLGSVDVQVTDGQARLGDGTIAGSTLTMAAAVRRAVHRIGMSVVDAANAASLVPATVLGLQDCYGSIQPGRAADLVIMDADLAVQGVMVGGSWFRPLRG